ncbi:MAG: histidine kinase [Ignavibacteriaceae bacterium]|nr:MAG: histidine kinase [Ignavibacteriaceae bacterium]
MIVFEQYFETSSEMMMVSDMAGLITKVNSAWKEKLGYEKSDIEGKAFLDFVHPDDVAATMSRFDQLLRQVKDTGFVNRYRRKDGEYIYVEWDVNILPDMMVSLAKDVTERELLKKKLVESEERLKLMFNSTSSVVALISEADRTVVDLNDAAVRLIGKNRADIAGKKLDFSSFWPDRVGISLFEAVFFSKGKVENFPATMIHPEKGRRRYLLSAAGFNYLGQPHFLLTANDYTDHYEKDQSLRKSEKRFAELFKNMHEAFVLCKVTDDRQDLEILQINKSFIKQTGLPEYTKVTGKRWTDVFPGARQDVLESYIKVGKTGVPVNYEAQSYALKKWFHGRVYSPERNHVAIIFEDITARKEESELILRQIAGLEKSAEEKEKFYSMLVHDLRSPFHGLINIADILTDDIDELNNDEIREFAAQLGGSLKNMYGNINEMLEWFVLTQGKQEAGFLPVDICASAKRSSEFLLGGMEAKCINFELKEKTGMIVQADPRNVESIFTNLLSNAIKFTPREGNICVEFEAGEEFITCRICDSGIGIPEKMAATLLDENTSFRRRGTEGEATSGLGLALTKGLVEIYGGRLWLESQVGRGTIFSFTLPKHHGSDKE